MTYVSYDKKGNILEYVDKNNNHTCYIWGYNYKYPIAEIQGATYDSVKSVLGHENNDLSYLQGYGEINYGWLLEITIRSLLKRFCINRTSGLLQLLLLMALLLNMAMISLGTLKNLIWKETEENN